MKADIFSDIHLDHWVRYYRRFLQQEVPKENLLLNFIHKHKRNDIVIFAGDSGNGYAWYQYVVDFLKKHYKTVISTPGNHCFYHEQGDFAKDHSVIQDVEGLKVLSCPLWTNFRGKAGWGEIAQRNISDFAQIKDLREAKVPWQLMQSEAHKYMRQIRDEKPDIVVTHFPIITKSIAAKYEGQELNTYFCNDEPDLVREVKPKLWVHGHTHTQFDYMFEGTRFMSNPIGYPFENFDSLSGAEMLYVEV